MNKGLSVTCSLCKAQFCKARIKLDNVIFEANSDNQGISWFCEHCQTVPGVKKLLARIGNIEAHQDELEDRVKKN